jgi:hypothetical protein
MHPSVDQGASAPGHSNPPLDPDQPDVIPVRSQSFLTFMHVSGLSNNPSCGIIDDRFSVQVDRRTASGLRQTSPGATCKEWTTRRILR